MENIGALKIRKKLSKSVLSYISEISLSQIIIFAISFIFSRASIFEVIRPFAVSFYVSVNLTGLSKVLALISLTLGNILYSNIYETLRQAISLLLFEAFSHMIFNLKERQETVFNRTGLITMVTALTGILRGIVQGLRVYDLVVSVLSAAMVFSLTIIFSPTCENFKKAYKNRVYDGRIIFSRAVLLSVFIISLRGIQVLGLDVGSVVAGIAIILIAQQRGGAEGAFAGALIGTVIAIYNIPSSLQIPGMLALAGAASGMPRKSKLMGSFLWLIVVTFFSGISVLTENMVLIYYESLAAGILYIIIPDTAKTYLGNSIAGLKNNTQVKSNNEYGQIQEAADKLFVLGKALSRISRNIEETIIEENERSSRIDWIAELVVEKLCIRCSFSDRCWRTNFVKTYRMVEKTIADLKIDETGQLEIPSWFKAKCTKAYKFFEILEAAYSLYKTENIWRKKLNESRILLARHASIVSGNVITAARRLLDTSGRDYEMEDLLLNTAVNSGIPVTSFRYNQRQGNKSYLEVSFDAKNSINYAEIDELVENSLNNKFVRVGENRRDMMGYSVIRYMKKPRCKSATGISRMSKNNDGISGDNFTFFISNEGAHINAISDGAGTGRRAEKYSRTAIQMLENLMEDGIELAQAVRLLNLYLDIRGESEKLATMDILSIDLTDGNISCYKYDAAPSFIKGKEGVTILGNEREDDSAEPVHYSSGKMEPGDIVVMVSDGVTQAFSQDGEISALQLFIDKIDTVNAQELADAVLNEAVIRSKENHDDITVLATRLW
ncbi:MAG: SpoIIE family protein phosphatase [Clostridiaceae bacterium]|nr:SpoIIE family protein phosphatase [Clostridiaceae bacterium]